MGTPAASAPAVSVSFPRDRPPAAADEMGMRPMQAKVWQKRGEPYLLIKSPPASGKSRALMFVALDKLHKQGLKQVIIAVPEKSIGASFHDEPLSQFGFAYDWRVEPRWNLCDAPGGDDKTSAKGKVGAVGQFLTSDGTVLVCTHATFRFAAEKFGVEAFDGRLIAIDEFHHVSSDEDNRLGDFVRQLIARDQAHLIAMTGSYFRGDAAAVLGPGDEDRFESVTFTYYEQLNGYAYLKQLDINYYFYTGSYLARFNSDGSAKKSLFDVLNPDEKTIVHIPNVNARESLGDKINEANAILSGLGKWEGADEATGFQLVRTPTGRVLRIADLVDDDAKRAKVLSSLKDPAQKNNRDHVDIILALGMAKEGFDWIWCEHALTVGYRSSLTEIVQIIGRATRDAPGKLRSRFTNLIAEPDASESAVTEAVNDTLKAIAASLLMEQVLAPRFEFRPKAAEGTPDEGPEPGFVYGPDGRQPDGPNVRFNPDTNTIRMDIRGLKEPTSAEAKQIIAEDLLNLATKVVQDTATLQTGIFDRETPPQVITQDRIGTIVRETYPTLSADDQESVRQHAVAAMNAIVHGTQAANDAAAEAAAAGDDDERPANTALIDGVRRFAMSVKDLSIDLIDSVNPFGAAYAILAKSLGEARLRAIAEVIAAKRVSIPPEEALQLAQRAQKFMQERGRPPSPTSPDAWEKRMAEGATAFLRHRAEGRYQK